MFLAQFAVFTAFVSCVLLLLSVVLRIKRKASYKSVTPLTHFFYKIRTPALRLASIKTLSPKTIILEATSLAHKFEENTIEGTHRISELLRTIRRLGLPLRVSAA